MLGGGPPRFGHGETRRHVAKRRDIPRDVSSLRAAASVVPLFTPGDGPPELLWARRPDTAPALAGFHVAPGGLLEDPDRDAPRESGDALAVTALRELFEEVGLLWARGRAPLEPDVCERLRASFRESAAAGHAHMRELGLRWRTDDLVPIGRWVTPSYARVRFDTTFFALVLPERIEPAEVLDELEHAEWVSAAVALSRWSAGRVLLAPPLAVLLRTLTRHGRLEPERLRGVFGASGEECQRWEVVPWLQMLPLRSPTLPPATHTNSFLVGSGRALLVEPATPYPDELERAVRWVEEARRDGIEPIALVATHHHPDHVGGAKALAERLNLPLWGHRLTAERLAGEMRFERLLEEGERIELPGPEPVALRVLHTPGHAPGHICLFEEHSRAMIVGDMVASVGTILVEPRDGDMRAYLASLERMRDEEPTLLLPAHGHVIRDPERVLTHYIHHRLAREDKVLGALSARGAPATAGELVPVAYDDAPSAVWPLAALSTEAHLLKLEADGRVRRVGERWVVLD